MTVHQAKVKVMTAIDAYDNGTMTREQLADSIQRSLFGLAHDQRADGYTEGFQDGANENDEEVEFESEMDLDEFREQLDNDDEEDDE